MTAAAACTVGEIAVSLRERGLDARAVAHFLDRQVFSLFADHIGLLPHDIVTRILEQSRGKPELFPRFTRELFTAMNSRVHEIWARSQGTQLRERESGFRYTPTTCFETFPFPEPTIEQREAIAAAARELDQLRERWLNPPEWVREEVLAFPGATDGPWSRYVHDPDDRGIGTVRYPRLAPKNEDAAAKLAKRTWHGLS